MNELTKLLEELWDNDSACALTNQVARALEKLANENKELQDELDIMQEQYSTDTT